MMPPAAKSALFSVKWTEAMRRAGRAAIWPVFAGVLVACGAGPTAGAEPNSPSVFDGERARVIVADQVALGPRVPGSEAHGRAGEYILARLQDEGWEVEEQGFDDRGGQRRNLIGRGGAAGGPLVILGAHYDTRPIADRAEPPVEAPVPGANDGASGAAVLLELARVLPADGLDFRLWLVFFDAEDGGGLAGGEWILGSRHFAATLEDTPAAVVVVDMVGDADLQLRYELHSDEALGQQIWATAGRLGYSGFVPEPGYSILDDHIPFLELGIPAVDLIDFDYPYWHTTEDTLDKVSADSLEQVGRTLQMWLTELDFESLE